MLKKISFWKKWSTLLWASFFWENCLENVRLKNKEKLRVKLFCWKMCDWEWVFKKLVFGGKKWRPNISLVFSTWKMNMIDKGKILKFDTVIYLWYITSYATLFFPFIPLYFFIRCLINVYTSWIWLVQAWKLKETNVRLGTN